MYEVLRFYLHSDWSQSSTHIKNHLEKKFAFSTGFGLSSFFVENIVYHPIRRSCNVATCKWHIWVITYGIYHIYPFHNSPWGITRTWPVAFAVLFVTDLPYAKSVWFLTECCAPFPNHRYKSMIREGLSHHLKGWTVCFILMPLDSEPSAMQSKPQLASRDHLPKWITLLKNGTWSTARSEI